MENLLPYDGLVEYYPGFIQKDAADVIFHSLLSDIPWESDVLRLFGKTIVTKRKVAWFGDPEASYKYSGSIKQPLPWIQELTELKQRVEKLSGTSFNACLLNLYHHGGEGMTWHADDEPELGSHPVIVSISLGAERRFSFKHRTSGERVDLLLEHGSALIMSGETQQHWVHALPKNMRQSASLFGGPEERINLTFRKILRI